MRARSRRGGSGKKPRTKTQRRSDGLSAPQRILRAKQIERIQQAREEDILKHATAITSPRNRDRPGWEHPSEAKQERLSELLNTNDRLLAMGKGRRTRRRS
jgi:hypothetical protein